MVTEGQRATARSRAWWAIGSTILAFTIPGGCGPSLGTTATSFLRKVKESPDPNIRYLAYAKLGSPEAYDDPWQKAQAVAALVAGLESGKEPVATRAVICRTLGTLGDPAGRPALLKAVEESEPLVRAEACRALGKVGRPEDATVLGRIMTVDTQVDCRVAAIEGLGDLKAPDPRIETLLVEGMDHDDPAIRFAALRSLRQISGKDLGVEVEPWRKYVLAKADHRREPSLAETAKAAPRDKHLARISGAFLGHSWFTPIEPQARPQSAGARPSPATATNGVPPL